MVAAFPTLTFSVGEGARHQRYRTSGSSSLDYPKRLGGNCLARHFQVSTKACRSVVQKLSTIPEAACALKPA